MSKQGIRLSFFRSLRVKLLFWFLLLALVPLAAAGVLAFVQTQDALRADAFSQLMAVATGRRNAVEMLMQVRLEQVEQIATRRRVRDALLNPTPEGQADLTADLEEIHTEIPAFINLYVLDAQGIVVAATDERFVGQTLSHEHEEGESGDEAHAGPELHGDVATGEVGVDLTAPVIDPASGQQVGTVLAHVGLAPINQIVAEREGLGQTGEAYLVNADRLIFTESRFLDLAPLQQEADTWGVREALAGREGVSTYAGLSGRDGHGRLPGHPPVRLGAPGRDGPGGSPRACQQVGRRLGADWRHHGPGGDGPGSGDRQLAGPPGGSSYGRSTGHRGRRPGGACQRPGQGRDRCAGPGLQRHGRQPAPPDSGPGWHQPGVQGSDGQ